ncbi:hypothetical protein AVEN_140664-1 [Araneus ventricosus]|uniref:Uncharacterized protein n=1 Tax=Araneus ventricosus TaxID=182803 RepID=A0A4Y2C5Z6_ARAVE|nr:hypothetical protein AVEN_140664-1 [Araneus ventricosus]
MAQFEIEYDAQKWRLFIDLCKRSLKALLLHNGNKYASIPVGHSVRYKECYENLAIILNKLKYKDHMWTLCGDLKVIFMLLGLQGEIQNIHSSCVSGTVGKGVNIGLRESGQ